MSTPLMAPDVLTGRDYYLAARRRRIWMLLVTALLSVAMTACFTAQRQDHIGVPLSLLAMLGTPILLWRYPRLLFYIILGSVCLFEVLPLAYTDGITDQVPFFWNLNTIAQRYAHVDLKGVPVNLFEILVIIAGCCSVVRAVFSGNVNIRTGPLIKPMAVYLAFVCMGWLVGLSTGGDFKLSLQEVRAQFYLAIAYIIASNLFQEKRQIGIAFWTMAVCLAIKGAMYTFRRYVTLAGLPLPDQGVGSHEEAFLFDAFEMLLLILVLTKTYKKLQYFMFAMLPIVMVGNLVCNRRAATAAILIALPILLAAAYRALPDRRKGIAWFGAILAVGFSIYYPLFKNSNGLIGKPARAISSQFTPDARDASSNAYRDAENADLMATIKLSPLIGYGYGKRMLHAVPIADISLDYEWWDVMTHNQILWVWMRVGTFGFIAFWIMICASLIHGCMLIRTEGVSREVKALGMFAITVVTMLTIFGLLDLQLVNFRDMLLTGLSLGMIHSSGRFEKEEKESLEMVRAS